MLKNLNILLCVSGGIAAYKAVDLASKLSAAGADVRTVMTENACKFIGPKSFEAVTRSAVFTSLWSGPEQFSPARPERSPGPDLPEGMAKPKTGLRPAGHDQTRLWRAHIALLDWTDIIVVAPATADIISKVANGICDDLLSTTICACWRKPMLFAPAMNNNMWENPIVQRNIATLKKMDFQLVGPAKGRLACGQDGIGRMAEPQDIFKAIEKIASKIKKHKARSSKSETNSKS